MRKSIATVSVRGALADKLPAIAAARFDGIELFDNDLIASDARPAEVARRVADLGLSIELFQPIRDVEGWRPDDHPAVLRRFRAKAAIANELGVDVLLACSNALPTAVDDPDLSAEQLSAIGDIAREHGLVVAFEALAWGTHVNRVNQAWDIVARAAHSNVGLCVDTFHLCSRGDGTEALEGIPGDRIVFHQVADAPRKEMAVLEWSRHYRNFPGQGGLDVVGVTDAVLRAGYRGPLSLKVFSDVVREAQPRDTALDAMRSLLWLEEEVRLRETSGVAEGRPRVDLFDPPPVPSHVDSGFVEIAVDEGDATLPTLLEALGFVHVATHRARPVQHWRNGRANLCVTWAPLAAVESRTRPATSALAVVTDRIDDVATRARALLWPPIRNRRGLDEAALAGMDTADGLHVFVGGHLGRDEDWRRDFLPVPGAAERADAASGAASDGQDGPDGPGAALGIDHIGVTTDPDAFDAEHAFFRTVLGLSAGPQFEHIHPDGRLRVGALRPARGNLRVVLATLIGDRREHGSRVDQIAIAVPDVIAQVQAARTRGVRLLDIPANYYDDLAARYDLRPEFLATLRENGIMYDRDEAGGEFLNAYTPLLGDGFYLELCERRGGYSGYGAGQAHVRITAQARQPAV